MPSLTEVIEAGLDPGWDHKLERALFAADDSATIAASVDRFARTHLGAPVASGRFYRASVGSVVGAVLADGREVVIKVNRAEQADRLGDAQVVQRHLALHGFPVPWPLLGPTPLADGVATVESLLERGEWADPHDPAVRARMATALHRLHELCRPLAGTVRLHEVWGTGLPPDQLWPEQPHDLRFDFPGTSDGAEWIDALAVGARERLKAIDLESLITHVDWRAEHLRFDGNEVSALYDCDSFARASEAVAVGSTAFAFTADWSRPDPYPTLDESAAFVEEYESVRAQPFDAHEREAIDAAHLYALAYAARCQHSDAELGLFEPGTSTRFIELLAERGECWLVPG